ncbi:uncharacterized protein LOC117296680 [Asterias rubens]|uniref:uncharacterized protein LOC117296680 n=1 Tax=Asterias rubens TaxID=7604 RepID=UPI001455690C|nr:uncharacterized protein LOC117296680 [Asterias rubens]
MGSCVVGRRAIVVFAIAILVVISVIGLLLGLLPQHERNTVKARSEVLNPWETTRLPLTLSPVSYNLLVRTDLTNFVFSGSVAILFECLEPTDLILIHANNLTIGEGRTKLKRDGAGTAPELLKEPWIYEENQFIVIELDGTLEKGEKYKLSLEFRGPLLDEIKGYYRMSYTTKAGEKRFIASTLFAPVGARKAFPCFDEPAMKATFTITLEHQPEYHALANAPKRAKIKTLRDGWIRTKFEESVKLSTYLVCYVISDFKAKFKTTANGVTFGVWAQADFINQTDYALEKGVAILDYFDGLYGEEVRYPMAKIDMIALPDFTAGAMENWGLITYRDTRILYEERVSSETQKQRVCTLVAHELSHQWFGNLVTMKWWDHLWLNEGFASFVEYVGTAEVEPDWGMWDKFILYDLHRAMATDARVTSRPIINEVETPAEISSMFNRISYQKGSSVLRMLTHFVGHDTFLKGLKYYLSSFAYSGAVTSDLWFHLDKAMAEDNVFLGDEMDLATVMKTWMHQMGFPVIKVVRDYTGNGQITARVEQKRFLSDPTSNTTTKYSDLGYVWYVPLTYTTSSSPDFESPDSKWIRPEDKYVTIETPGSSTDWLLLNIDQRGIYRVNYDDQNWELIKAQLDSNHEAISTASRASLISDAFSLAEASEISQSQAFDMTTYLKEERDFVPWQAVKGALSSIEKNLQRKRAFGNFKKYMKENVTPFYKFVGWDNTGNHLTRMSRAEAISMACKYGSDDCIEISVKHYAQWMMTPERTVVHPDIQPTVYCSAIAAGGQDEWDFAFDVYRNPNTPASARARLLAAMACSHKPWILNTFLHYTLDHSTIRSQDGVDVIIAVAGNPVGLPLAWDFFRANWDFFRTVYGDTVFLLKRIIGGVTSHLNTPFELQSLERFIEDHPDQGTGQSALTGAVAVVKGNIRWIEQNYEDVARWLKAAVDESGPWLNFRLPKDVTPVNYDLKLRTDLTKFVFNGSVNILIECQLKTDVILLHTRRLNITEGVVLTHAAGGHSPTISKEWLYPGNEYLVVELNSYLVAGERYNLYLDFNGPLFSDEQGLYWLTYHGTDYGEQRIMATTLFAAYNARKAFPCFDEPAMKATFTITLEHQPEYHALANSAKSGDDEVLSDGWIRATFVETVKMSTYLVCFVISDYKAKFTTTANGIKFGVWAPEELINQTDYALEKGAAILDFLDDYFGMEVKYPMAKLDMVALPRFPALAMEHWGLVSYRSNVVLVREGVTTAVEKQMVYTTIAHELVHQWFGNLVTMEWWDELWLNEGISRYFEYPITAALEPNFVMMDKFVAFDIRTSMLIDGTVDSRPVVAEVIRAREIMSMFDTITYSKGASLLRMIKYFLGESTLMKGLKSLLRAAQYDSIENSDLWIHLENAAIEDNINLEFEDDMDLGTVMTSWLSQIGHPVITISRSYSGDDKITATASQKRFLTDPTTDVTATHFPDLGYQWYVPLVYVTSANPNFSAPELEWLSPTTNVTIERDDIGGDTDWLLMNIDQGGFYHVNYDETNWKLLAKQLSDNHQVISTDSRSSIVNDAFQLAKVGEINTAIVLELISYFRDEREYVPWLMLTVNLRFIREQLIMSDSFSNFEAYIKDLVTPIYDVTGWEIEEGDIIEEQMRTCITAIACLYNVETCTSTAADLFRQWLADAYFYIHPYMKTNVLCAGIAGGSRADWDDAFMVYSNHSTDSSRAYAISEALACSRDEATLSRYLKLILNSSITSRGHGGTALAGVAANPLGRELAWDFYKSNVGFFLENFGHSRYSYSNIIGKTTSGFTTREKLMEVEHFFEDHPDAEDWKTQFDEAVVEIKSNIEWADRHLHGVTEWLENAG